MHSFFAYYSQNTDSHGLILSPKLPIDIIYNFLFWIFQTPRKFLTYLAKNGSKIEKKLQNSTFMGKKSRVIEAEVNDLPF